MGLQDTRAWTIKVGVEPPKDPVLAPNGLPLGTDDLEQGLRYWKARRDAMMAIDREIRDQELQYVNDWLGQYEAELTMRGLL